MIKPKFGVADISRLYAEQYRQTHAMSEEQRLAMAAIMASCHTSQLGSHQEVCDHCDSIRGESKLPIKMQIQGRNRKIRKT